VVVGRRVDGLSNGLQHIFKLVVEDHNQNLSAGATAAATPDDLMAPEDVTGFTLTPGNQLLRVSWQPSLNSEGDLVIQRLTVELGATVVALQELGPSALSRFERDVIGAAKVRWLIILEGINDIGQAQGAEAAAKAADDLIAAYEQMIDSARASDIRVYGATLMPFGGSFYDTAESEAARKTVNEWIRSSGRFDAVIDLDAALRDPADSLRLLPAADTGDHLHPNETGHRMIAEAVDLTLFNGGEN
jgi:lysophospholipase L1-like esterase